MTDTTCLQKGLKEPYDWDEYAEMFFPKAQELAEVAAEAEKAGEKEKASEYYLSVFRIYPWSQGEAISFCFKTNG